MPGWLDLVLNSTAMRVHHLNCGTLCPPFARLVDSDSGWFARGRLLCHCLLIETRRDGLVLVDTGIGLRDMEARPTLPWLFRTVASPVLDPGETAARQVEGLGYSLADVRHIVATHLDLDHAGGLCDFPQASLHVHDKELRALQSPRGMMEKHRYVKQHVASCESVHRYDNSSGDAWFGLPAAIQLDGIADDVALIPLHGHSRGHSGVAVNLGERWLLHAGDAYFHRGELKPEPTVPMGLRAFQELMQIDGVARAESQNQLRSLHRRHGREVEIFCAHDPDEFASMR